MEWSRISYIDVVFELSGDGYDGSTLGHRSFHKLGDVLVLLLRLRLLDEIDFVLQDQDLFQFHNLYGS